MFPSCGSKARKAFFSEKKKQETFDSAVARLMQQPAFISTGVDLDTLGVSRFLKQEPKDLRVLDCRKNRFPFASARIRKAGRDLHTEVRSTSFLVVFLKKGLLPSFLRGLA